jgi:hypothetical protein
MNKTFEIVSSDKIAKYEKTIKILIKDILKIDKYLITDESTINDFRSFRSSNGTQQKDGSWEFEFFSYDTEKAKADGAISGNQNILDLKRKDREKYKIIKKINVEDDEVSKDEELVEKIFSKFQKRPCTIMFSMPIYKLAEFLSN